MASGTLVVVIGAGASYDCLLPDSTQTPEYRPPLAKDLFSPNFKDILRRYPGAQRCSGEIRALMSTTGISLEQALRKLADDAKPHIKRNFRGVPLYLRELLGRVQENYITHGSNAFDRLVDEIFRVVPETFQTVLFLTLNYDTFLEEALWPVRRRPFKEVDDYVQTDARFALIKLHGSVTWVHPLHPTVYERVMDGADLPREGDIVVVDSYSVASIDGTQAVYPALAIPVDGKTGFYCPATLCETASKWLMNATDLLVLGCSVVDPDILTLLGSMPRLNRFKIVNGSATEGDAAWDRLRVHQVFQDLPGHMPAFAGGFTQFVTGDALVKFLEG